MKPLLLTATAFGPFAETVAIDFTRLQGQPLFLIHGDTGAGKTSVLDALCFALYGEPTGSHRESRNLRSDFAYPDTLTEVSLTFALGVQHYRAVRTPEQERRKARGSGTRGKGLGKGGGTVATAKPFGHCQHIQHQAVIGG